MEHEIQKLNKGHAFGVLFFANFLLSFHLFFVIYMNSSFLGTFISEKFVGTIYMVSSALTILSLLLVSKLLKKFGNYKILFFLTIVEFLLFLGLAFFKNAYLVIAIFIAYGSTFPLILFNFDIFLESYTKVESITGKIRGTFLAITNTALILAPLVAGLIITNSDYWKIYLISSLFLIPFIFLIYNFRNFEDPEYHELKIWSTLKYIKNHKNLYNIFMTQFMLRFFFSWMVIYMPIYLHQYIGFTWSQIGLMTAIMLLPFVFVEYPAGRIADKVLGEKELLVVGFIISGIFTGLISFINTSDFIIWTALLFTIRIGASLVEIMSEIYFFKHVSGDDSSTISFFRITRPAAYIIGPGVASIALLFIDFQFIFLIMGFLLLIGIRYSLKIEDTM